MRIHFLGTMGWFDSKLGNTLCVLVDTGKEYIIFDAGTGIYKIDTYIKDKRPIYLFLSHFHLDHIIGLHILNKFSFSQGIKAFGPKGTEKMFKLVINSPYSKPISKLKTKITVRDLRENLKFPFNIRFKELLHTTVCYGYRLHSEGKVIAFCTDTGPCDGIKELAKDADVLIAESSLPPATVDRGWPHLNPEQAARTARAANAKKLALVHFDSGDYPKDSNIALAKEAAQKIFKNTLAARDGLCLKV
jgi:ribonuclease BN (tRNA processing enzyme)